MNNWQPIETYDKLKRKPQLAVFRFAPIPNERICMDEVFRMESRYGHRICTHWMPFAPPETTDG